MRKPSLLEDRLNAALRLLERVPKLASDAAFNKGNNAVPYELHAAIEPFVDKTRAWLKSEPAERRAKAKAKSK